MEIAAVIFILAVLIAAAYGMFSAADEFVLRHFDASGRMRVSVCVFAVVLLIGSSCVFGVLTLHNCIIDSYDTGYADAEDEFKEKQLVMGKEEDEEDEEETEGDSPDYDAGYIDGYKDGYSGAYAAAAEVFEGVEKEKIQNQDVPDTLNSEETEELSDTTATETQESATGENASAVQEPEEEEADDTGKTGITVYYTPSGSVLHYDPNCPYLKNSSEVLSCDKADAPDRPDCSRCGPGN